MHEWLLLRFVMFGALVAGGVLFAYATKALDKWRERRARARSARQDEVLAAEYRAAPTQIDGSQGRVARARGGREGGDLDAKFRTGLSDINRATVCRAAASGARAVTEAKGVQ